MYTAVSFIIAVLKKIIPRPIVRLLRTPYHFLLAFFFALINGFPAQKMFVVGVTGTKGKSTVTEMLFTLLRAGGHSTALASTIRFALNDHSEPNRFKMTMQGRGHLQDFLGRARKKGATHAVVEITSEGTRQFRNSFLFLDALVVTNISKEHIESHGSFEKYIAAKRSIVRTLETSSKKDRLLVSNNDNEHTAGFLSARVPHKAPFSQEELQNVALHKESVSFSYKNTSFTVPFPGIFSALNALSAIKVSGHYGMPRATLRGALATMPQVQGRLEPVSCGQNFRVIVDYAHTPDSLAALYEAFPEKKICVLGNTGGGRDTWKRPLMGKIADARCAEVILTNEDPYDEDPEKIIHDMCADMKKTPSIILDRREAIRTALTKATPGDVVLISGKGTDPYIMEANGKKTPWSDAQVVREELEVLGFKK